MKIKAIRGLALNPIHYFDLLKVEVYAQLSEGHMFIASNGGNGNQGQKGADGKMGLTGLTRYGNVIVIVV